MQTRPDLESKSSPSQLDEEFLSKVKKLISENKTEEIQRSACEAASKGYIQSLQYLLSEKKVDANQIFYFYQTQSTCTCTTLLLSAIKHDQKNITAMLLDNFDITPKTLNYFAKTMYSCSSKYDGNALTYAIINGDLNLIDRLLKKSVDPDAFPLIGAYEAGLVKVSALMFASYPVKGYARVQQDEKLCKEMVQLIKPYSKLDISKLTSESAKYLLPLLKSDDCKIGFFKDEKKASVEVKLEAACSVSAKP